MMTLQFHRHLLAGLLICASAAGFSQVTEVWQINQSNAASTGNEWLTVSNRGHSIAFIPAAAPQNHYDFDILALLPEETQTAPIRLLAAEDGTHLASFGTSPTFDAFRDHARMAVSADGYIYIMGSSGTVHRYKPDGSDHRVTVSNLVYPPGNAISRAFAITGSESLGTLRLFVGRASQIFIFGNSEADPNTMSLLGTINTGVSNDLMVIAARGNRVYAASITAPQLRMFEVSYSPFSYTDPVFVGPTEIKQSADLNASGNIIAMTLFNSTTGDECAVGQLEGTGTVMTVIPALPDFDRNNNGFYDGGPRGFSTYGATSDLCFNPAANEIYGYHPHSNPALGQRGPAIYKLSIPTSSVTDWTMY